MRVLWIHVQRTKYGWSTDIQSWKTIRAADTYKNQTKTNNLMFSVIRKDNFEFDQLIFEQN